MLKRFYLLIFLLVPAFGATAQADEDIQALLDALRLQEIVAVMQEEGYDYGQDLDRELLELSGGVSWRQRVAEIYEFDLIWDTFLPQFSAELDSAEVKTMIAFFDSDLGRRIITLEITARRALLDEDMESDSRETLRQMAAEGDPRLAMLKDFIEANDLVELNVMSAMNSNYAFYIGLSDGQAFEKPLNEEDILRDVWSQEEQTRIDTEEWIYTYLALAYRPLSDADLQAYIDFSNTKAGRSLNAALFAGFDDVFRNVSRALGLSAAEYMKGEDL